MKKLFNKKFILILASAMLLLVVLVVGSFLLTNENKKSFSRDGYIISFRKEEASERVYFDEGTNYKTNINSQLVFTDTSGEKVNVDKDNFLHYTDGGIKFLKNGVIMDLENINDAIVPYYNITNKTVLEYSNKSYYVEAIDKTLAFNNLIGRISDNKYIVAGVNIKLQLAGNEKLIEGDYFEITFIEDGIIKVENQEVSYQTTAQSSYVLVNDTTRIDLGTKKIYYNDEDKMSLTQMTIDGNENIEIVPEKEDDGTTDDENTSEEDNNNVENPPVDNPNQPNDENQNDGSNQEQPGEELPGENPEDEPGNETPGDDEKTEDNPEENNPEDNPNEENPEDKPGDDGEGTGNVQKKSATIELIEAQVGVNNISARFVINDPDESIQGDLTLKITNMDTGKQVYGIEIDKTKKEFLVGVSTLSSDTNYLLSINEENNGSYDTQYFQKLFRTDSLGIKLVKKYITSNSIAYAVDFGNSPVQSVNLTLYDKNFNPVSDTTVVKPENDFVFYEGLTSNTDYNIELNNVILNGGEYGGLYKINKTIKTLKKVPNVSGLIATTNEENRTFTIGINEVKDPDKSIKRYIYEIYKASDITYDNMDNLQPVMTIENEDNSKVVVEIDGEKIKEKISYRFRLIVEYHDNEKYGEIETGFSKNLVLADKPYVEFEQDFSKTTFNKIAGTIRIIDKSCTIPFYGKVCYTPDPFRVNKFKIGYKLNGTSDPLTWITEGLDFKISKTDPSVLEYDFELGSLSSGLTYDFNLHGDVDYLDGYGIRPGILIGPTFSAKTTTTDSLKVDSWVNNGSSLNDLINISPMIVGASADEYVNESLANSMKKMIFNLYAGDVEKKLQSGNTEVIPIATKTLEGDLRELYYNTLFTINTLDTFDFKDTPSVDENGNPIVLSAIDVLKSKTDGILQEKYTIEITGIEDEVQNKIGILNNTYVFETPGTLIAEDENLIPQIVAKTITKDEYKTLYSEEKLIELLGSEQRKIIGETPVALDVYISELEVKSLILRMTQVYDKITNPTKKLIYYICDADKNIDCSLEEAITTHEIDLTEEEFDTKYNDFILNFGTKFSVTDKILTRGHNYVVKAKFLIDTDDDGEGDILYPSVDIKTEVEVKKQYPTNFNMQIVETTDDKVIYRYSFNDIDNTVYDNKMYYVIEKVTGDSGNISEDNGEENPDNSEGDVNNDVVEEPEVIEPSTSEKMSVERSKDQFELTGLTTDDVYKLTYKIAPVKNSKSIREVSAGNFIFDGKLIYNSDTIKFETISEDDGNELKLVFKATNSNQMLVDRISAFDMTLSANGVNDYRRIYPTNNTSVCNIEGVDYRCIIIDYANIKEFKGKNVNVDVVAYYDTGIVNNTIFSKDGFLENTNGFIIQQNNYYKNSLERASYITFSNSSKTGTVSKYPSGIYSFNPSTNNTFYIKSLINTSTFLFETGDITAFENAYTRFSDSIFLNYDESKGTSNKSMNNKYLDKVEVGSDDNHFRFNNIIPKVNVSTKNLVNGSIITINATGIDNDILKNEFQNESDGKYYYYMNIYKDSELTELYKKEKVEISLEDTGSVIELIKFMPDTTYHYTISAILKKSDGTYRETILFDNSKSGYTAGKFSFSTLNKKGILYGTDFNYVSNSTNQNYLERTLNLEIQTNRNIGNYQIKLEFYDNKNLNTDGTPKLLLEGVFDPIRDLEGNYYDVSILSSKITDPSVNIDLIYGGSDPYLIKAYMLTESCTGDNIDNLCDTTAIQSLPIYDESYGFVPLKKPNIKIDSTSDTNELTFNIQITDPDKVIVNGEFCYQLQNEGGGPLKGTPYDNKVCGLSVRDLGDNYVVKFSNLLSNTGYTLHVEANVDINNVNMSGIDDPAFNNKTAYTKNDYDMSIGTVGAYTNNSYSVTLLFTNSIELTKLTSVYYSIKNERTGVSVANGTVQIGDENNFKQVEGGYELKIKGLDLDKEDTYTIVNYYYIGEQQVDETTNNFAITTN